MKLEIISTSLINDYNATGIASTVTGAQYVVSGNGVLLYEIKRRAVLGMQGRLQ